MNPTPFLWALSTLLSFIAGWIVGKWITLAIMASEKNKKEDDIIKTLNGGPK